MERATLLLADDSVTIQRVIELTFADESVDVVAVGDGKAAIEQLAADPPDIVLADVGMPERDGYEVAEHIKGTPQLSHIPVLLLTGAFEPVDDARAKKIGCDGVLVKPFEPQMVISRVRELLQAPRPRKGPVEAPRAPAPVATPQPARPSGLATSDLDRLEPIGPDPARQAGDALEDYFDRLDAALANLGAGQPPPPEPELVVVSHRADAEPIVQPPPPEPRPQEPVSAWNPPVSATPAAPKPQPAEPPAAVARAVERPSADFDAQLPRGPIPQLHAAFAALLAAEQGEPVEAQLPPPEPSLTEDQIEQIATRVIARMGDDRMRALVLDVAERLVREEIDRIKRG